LKYIFHIGLDIEIQKRDDFITDFIVKMMQSKWNYGSKAKYFVFNDTMKYKLRVLLLYKRLDLLIYLRICD